MDPLIILALSTAVFVVVFSVQSLIKHMRNAPENMMWFHQHRIRVNATVTHVQAGRGWKDEEGCYRDPWDGCMKQNKIWQTYYDVTAQWKDRQTQQMYTFYSKAWPDDIAKKPIEGKTVEVIVDPHNPKRYIIDFHTLS